MRRKSDDTEFIFKYYKQEKDFRSELAILSDLDHPNIVRPVCYSTASKKLLIAIPFYENGSLNQIPHRLRQDQLRLITAQLISAVKYIHAKGYIHYDIKPGNILLDAEYNAILIDFGLACKQTRERFKTGTHFTMAPEVVKARGFERFRLTTSLDWWSIGVTVWIMNNLITYQDDDSEHRHHTYTQPFKVRKTKICKKKYRIRNHMKHFPEHFSSELREFLSTLLVPNPAFRDFSDTNVLEEMPYLRGIDWIDNDSDAYDL